MMIKKAGFKPIVIRTIGLVLEGTPIEKVVGRRIVGYMSFIANKLNLGDSIMIYSRKPRKE
jgi:hypothetical protein